MQFLNDPEAQDLVKNTKMLSGIAASDFDAIFYVGGHGPGTMIVTPFAHSSVLDLATDATSIALSEEMWRQGKVVSAICHGPAALVNVKDANGKPIVSGRKVTCFSNTEEEQVKLTKQIPFLVETRLKEVFLSLLSSPNGVARGEI
jgi:putative intracellular protease/amidase